jgi:hypothetical protein
MSREALPTTVRISSTRSFARKPQTQRCCTASLGALGSTTRLLGPCRSPQRQSPETKIHYASGCCTLTSFGTRGQAMSTRWPTTRHWFVIPVVLCKRALLYTDSSGVLELALCCFVPLLLLRKGTASTARFLCSECINIATWFAQAVGYEVFSLHVY